MNCHRRAMLLSTVAVRNIPASRRIELIEAVTQWVESEDCPAESSEELFYMLYAEAVIAMANYCEEWQAEEGRRILEKNFG